MILNCKWQQDMGEKECFIMELNINDINNIAERIRENSYHGDSNVTEWIEELARRDEQAKKAARRLLHAQAKAELRRSERAWARREARITRKIVVKGLCFITAINAVAEALGIANREYALAEGNADMAKAAKAVLAVIDDEEAAKARAEKLAANAVRNALRRQQKAAKAARKADKLLNAEIAAAIKGERKDARKLLPKKAARSQVALPADVGVLDTAVTTAELKAFVDGGCICSTARDIELVELDDGFPCLTLNDIGINPVGVKTEGELTAVEHEAFDVAVAGDNVCYDFLHKKVKLTKAEKKAAIKVAASKLDIAKKATRESHAYGKAVIDAHLDKRQVQYQSFVLSGGGQDPVYGNLQSTSFGMNVLTERYYENAADDDVFAFDKGTVRLFNNVMETRKYTREMKIGRASCRERV